MYEILPWYEHSLSYAISIFLICLGIAAIIAAYRQGGEK